MHACTLRRLALAAAGLMLAPAASATTLVHMNLKDLATRADRIFRGRVVAVDTGTVRAGGGDLPTIVYRLRVEEAFKGQFEEGKGRAVVELRMVGTKAALDSGTARRHTVLRDVPALQMGREYVLFTTRPSSIGLSTTVGLGQGAFTILGTGKQAQAVNAFGNRGLARGMETSIHSGAGPVPYARLAQAIRAALNP
jgi:hypothetical protein